MDTGTEDTIERVDPFKMAIYPKKRLDGLWLKVIGFILTLLDHIGLLFQAQIGDLAYQILRCTGRLAFPIFVLLAVEGVYHTRNYWKYFARLAVMAIVLDAFCYITYYAFPESGVAIPPGNVFTDLALGTLVIYLFKRNDPWTMFALLPMAYLVLSDFTPYRQGVDSSYALIKAGIASDYGTYGLVMFLAFYFAYEIARKIITSQAEKNNLDLATLASSRMRLILNSAVSIALLAVGCIYQVISMLVSYNPCQPAVGWAMESWSMLSIAFIMLYDGRPGIKSSPVRYSLYLFYPVHLIVLYLITLAF